MQIFQLLDARTVASNSPLIPAGEFSTPANPHQVGQVVFRVPRTHAADNLSHNLSGFDYYEVWLSVSPRNPLNF